MYQETNKNQNLLITIIALIPKMWHLLTTLPRGVGKQGWRSGEIELSPPIDQCGPVSIPGVDAICGFPLLLVLVPVPRVLSGYLLHKSQHSQIPTEWTRSHSVKATKSVRFSFIYFLVFFYARCMILSGKSNVTAIPLNLSGSPIDSFR